MDKSSKALKVRLAALTLKSPLIGASGTLGYIKELPENFYDFFGAVATKTLTLLPRQGNPPPRLFETACGLINSIGLENPGIDIFIKENWPALSKLKVPVIVSIAGNKKIDFVKLAERLDSLSGLSAIELNISCPNVEAQGKGMFSQDAGQTSSLTKAVRKVTQKTLIVKLTPNVTDICLVARAAEAAGADGLCVSNTYFATAVDIKTRQPRLGNITGGLSGPAIKPLALYSVYKIANAVKIPIIASGGIMTHEDALEFIVCGATCVSLGTANFIDINAGEKICQGIREYLKKQKITGLEKLRGTLKV